MPLWQPTNAIARPAYYDRQAIGVASAYEGVAGPHGTTVRWSYTPIGGGAAFIESLYAYMVRQTNTGLLVYSECYCEFLPFYGGVAKIFDLVFSSNVNFSSVYTNQTSFGYMAFGDTLRSVTQNSDSGGTITFGIAFKGTEFIY